MSSKVFRPTQVKRSEIPIITIHHHGNAMNNEREILFNSVTATINIQPTNEMFLQIMTSRDITVVKSLAQFIYGCFKQINC